MAKLMLAIGVILASVGCMVDPVPGSLRQAKDNPAVTVETIATFDGIRVYRVNTGDRFLYVAARASGDISANWTERHGKVTVPVTAQMIEP